MIKTLNCSEKLAGLSLIKAVGLELSIPAFANVISSSLQDARTELINLRKTHVLSYWGIVEKRGAHFFLYSLSSHSVNIIDETFLDSCSCAVKFSLERAMQSLKERTWT